jgi:hypothetical protein
LRRSGGVAVIVTFHTFGLSLQERLDLGVSDDFREAVVDRPDGAADSTGDDVFGETIRVEVNVNVLFMSLANRAFHLFLLSFFHFITILYTQFSPGTSIKPQKLEIKQHVINYRVLLANPILYYSS